MGELQAGQGAQPPSIDTIYHHCASIIYHSVAVTPSTLQLFTACCLFSIACSSSLSYIRVSPIYQLVL